MSQEETAKIMLDKIKELVKSQPNDMELGKIIRQMINNESITSVVTR